MISKLKSPRLIQSFQLSNPLIEKGSLRYDLKKPFDLFVNVPNLENWRARWDEFRTYRFALSLRNNAS
jgi:hypothetical protein